MMRIILSFILLTLSSALYADDFYKGKTIHLITSRQAGSTTDLYARMMVPYLKKELSADVIVEHKPGAGGLTSIAYMLTQAKDGLYVLMLDAEGPVIEQALEGSERYDLSKIKMLSRISYETRMVGVKKGFNILNMPPNEFALFGGDSRNNVAITSASILCYALDIKCKMILGYQLIPEIDLAIERGELNSLIHPIRQIEAVGGDKKYDLIYSYSSDRLEEYPNVPTIFESKKISNENKKLIRFRTNVAEFGRVIAISNLVPLDRTTQLRQAIDKILTDPNIVKISEKTTPINYASMEELDSLKNKVNIITEQERALLNQIIYKMY